MSEPYFQNEDDRRGRRWTGWTVLATLLVFFGIIFAVNGVMIYAALSTMAGVDTESAYQAGRQFEREAAAAKAQDARHWRVDARVTPAPDGARRLEIQAVDAAGLPVGDVAASAVFERPTDRRLDRTVEVVADSPGRFHGSTALAAGQWDLVLELTRRGEQVFLSRNRIVLK